MMLVGKKRSKTRRQSATRSGPSSGPAAWRIGEEHAAYPDHGGKNMKGSRIGMPSLRVGSVRAGKVLSRD